MAFWNRKKKKAEEALNENKEEGVWRVPDEEEAASDKAEAASEEINASSENASVESGVTASVSDEDDSTESVSSNDPEAASSGNEGSMEAASGSSNTEEIHSISSDTDENSVESFESAENEPEKADLEEASAMESEEESESSEEEKPKKKEGFFRRLVKGLAKTRANFVKNMDYVFRGFTNIDDDFYEELEEILIMGDIGVRTTEEILDELKEEVKAEKIKEPEACREILIRLIRDRMFVPEDAYDFLNQKSVIMVVGVNGVGKTTTIGKLARKLKDSGRSVLISAADTFRAAAGDQLKTWADRAGVPMIGGQDGADPAAVVYDSVQAAKSRETDIVLVDTAGRLHNKKNLMQELSKMNRVIDREYPEAHRETFVVLDATTGQNALQQAREFDEVTDVTGIILTKMDGTAKGGIAVAVQSELKKPVKYIGVGETAEDLERFDPDDFVEALFRQEEEV